ncbi:MAG: PEGA domain-containing protein [Proteobacteria bacterium]|nr:PEGA domain-containing protein [Pseudomonadota bacterium]
MAWVDGVKQKEKTPLTVYGLAAGNHSLKLFCEGYVRETLDVTVSD